MAGIVKDRRTDEQKDRTYSMVAATDSFMSGWGDAPGRSLFAVAVGSYERERAVLEIMHSRPEMQRVRIVGTDYSPRLREGDHLSIAWDWDDRA